MQRTALGSIPPLSRSAPVPRVRAMERSTLCQSLRTGGASHFGRLALLSDIGGKLVETLMLVVMGGVVGLSCARCLVFEAAAPRMAPEHVSSGESHERR